MSDRLATLPTDISVIPSRFLWDKRTSCKKAALRVLVALGAFIPRETINNGVGYCTPSISELARTVGVSNQAIQRQIRILSELGYIEVIHRQASNKGALSNLYRVVFENSANHLPAQDVCHAA